MNRLQEKGFRQLLDASADALLVVDLQGCMVAVNLEAQQLFGWTEAELLGEPLNRVIPPRFQQLTESQLLGDSETPGTPPKGGPVSLFARRRDGTEFPIEFTRSPLGPGSLTLVTIRDLTKWRRAQDTLFRDKEQAFVTLASIADAIITTDMAGTITYLNPMAERLSGWRTTEALGQPLGTVLPLFSEATRQPIESIPARCLLAGRAVDLVDGVLLLRRDGTEVAIGDSAAPLRDRNGATTGVVLVFHDVTERRRAVRTLTHDATHDSLTGLISRQAFEQRLARVLSSSADGPAEHVLCYLDLDRFKLVNDSCGHEAGDDLLKRIASLLAGRLRSHDTIARLGGDEFGILLEHCSLAKAEEIAGNLLQAVATFRFVWGETSFSLGASIGVVPITAATSGLTADVLRAADTACYAAKNAGGNRVHLGLEAAPGVQEQVETPRITRLARAVDENLFQLYAQAIVPLALQRPGRPRCEVLLCLPDERGGVETPDVFLPQAERYRLIPAIDRWVVRQTVALLGQWHRDHPECELPLCSINLSASSLHDADLITAVREYLTQHQLPPEALCFEIAEPAALGNFGQLVRLISEIRSAGLGVGLEDFGGGLTSFANLKALPVDYVKIGGHYVRGVVDDPVYGTLVSTVNQIGRIMGITTIADEVESETVLQQLRALGVDYAQGHAVAPPAPLVDAEGVVAVPCIQRSM
ncbi:MAG TPA: EAL domain-containing protein [Gemmatimonadales bacterium]|nr:EAL domain-containing protein [Gemmatimonadales bacterium]